MKTTIKIDAFKSIVVQPNAFGPGAQVLLCVMAVEMASAILTPDQCAALALGLELASYKVDAA